MIKLKKKKKTISTTELVNQILRVDADAKGVSLKEYKKQREAIQKSQEEYKKTHWVSDLTDAQLFFIATTPKGLLLDDSKEYYMGKPLSKENHRRLARYKENSKGYLEFITSVNRVKRLRDGVEKDTRLFRDKVNNLKDIIENKIPFKNLQQEYQNIGRKLRGSLVPSKAFVHQLYTPDLMIGGVPVEVKIKSKAELIEQARARLPVDKTHGLNTLMKKHGMMSTLDIADHFLKVFNDPKKSDYYVEGYDNADAFAEACGVLPVKVFELIAREVKTRKKHYKKQRFISKGVACEELVNEWNTRRTKDDKYPYSDFFRTKFRIDWSLRHGYPWENYKRFMEDFPQWVTIFNARAKKYGTREEAEAEVHFQLLSDSKLGK